MTAKPQITYVRGRGVAEVARLIFAVKDVETTEEHITTKAEFSALRSTGKLMFQQLPLVEIDGLCLIESNAQAAYLGLKYDLLGNTDQEKGMVQMLFHGAKSFKASCQPSWPFQLPEKSEELQQNAIRIAKSRYLPAFEKALADNGTGFLVGGSPTIADCALFDILSYMKEMSEYGNILDEAPNCKAFVEKFSAVAGVNKYLNSPRRFPIPDIAYATEAFVKKFSDVDGVSKYLNSLRRFPPPTEA